MITDRRTLLAGFATIAASTAFSARAQENSTEETIAAIKADPSLATTERQFRLGVIGPAELSLASSQLAVEKATNARVKEFAGWELTEAKGVTSVLEDLGTPIPKMDAKFQAILDTLQTATGAEFDEAYIAAQLENHEFLRDLAQAFLENSSPSNADMAEMHGRHLATLALGTFIEHVDHTSQILGELRA